MAEKLITETEARLATHEQVCAGVVFEGAQAGFPWTITWPDAP